jgi:E3 ubiquitin-protein ligase RGLG
MNFVLIGIILLILGWIFKKNKVTHNYKSLKDVGKDVSTSLGVKNNVIMGFDFTHTHNVSVDRFNKYQEVIRVIGITFFKSEWIPCFGFNGKSCFSFTPNDKLGCYTFTSVMNMYNTIAPKTRHVTTRNFAPIIEEAIDIAKYGNKFYVLYIICEGQAIDGLKETRDAIVKASRYPLSIVIIGVNTNSNKETEMYKMYTDEKLGFDDSHIRKWNNVYFVSFDKVMGGEPKLSDGRFSREQEVDFSVAITKELSNQNTCVRALNII